MYGFKSLTLWGRWNFEKTVKKAGLKNNIVNVWFKCFMNLFQGYKKESFSRKNVKKQTNKQTAYIFIYFKCIITNFAITMWLD